MKSNVVNIDHHRPHFVINAPEAVYVIGVDTMQDIADGKLPVDTLSDGELKAIINDWMMFLMGEEIG